MIMNFVSSAALAVALSVSAAAGPADVLATQGGYTLTQGHFERAVEIERALSEDGRYSEDEQAALKEDMLIEFGIAPAELLEAIDELYAELNSVQSFDVGADTPEIVQVSSQDVVGDGHRQMRRTMTALLQGAELVGDAYTSAGVNELRDYMTNSQIISSNFNDHSSSKRVFTFCPGGRFFYYFGSVTDIETRRGVGLSGFEKKRTEGVWDAYHEGGQVAVLMYSTAPAFASESLNNSGFLPVPIAQMQSDLIQIGARGSRATPDMLMRRIPNVGC